MISAHFQSPDLQYCQISRTESVAKQIFHHFDDCTST